jgi:D-lactate dehydrogenase (cytochrome)
VRTSSDVSRDYPSYLNDESGLVRDGHADRIFFPTTEDELREIVRQANEQQMPFTISGGGTGISGGRVPLSGWIISTEDMFSLISKSNSSKYTDSITSKEFEYHLEVIDETHAHLTLPVSMTVKGIQELCRELGWFYPPDPTERSCFIGGNVVTNASGARSFKFGPTRNWIHSLRVILPNSDLLSLDRNSPPLGSQKTIEIEGEMKKYSVPRPQIPFVESTKNVAGLVISDDFQPIDLFVGNDGLMGIISEVTIKLIPQPSEIINIFVYVDSLQQAIELAKIAQQQRIQSLNPIPMSVEYLDDRAISILSKKIELPPEVKGLVILEQEASSEDILFEYINFWTEIFDQLGIIHTSVAQTLAEVEHHKDLRHMIPETINEMARQNGQPKLGTDYSAPLQLMEEMHQLAVELGENFEGEIFPEGRPGNVFGYAIWSHFGDNHVHLNFLPRTEEQKELAKSYMTKYMRQVVDWKGSIAAEHGLGKKTFEGAPALQLQLGFEGLKEIYDIKKILDPLLLLNRENLLGRNLARYEV